MKNRKIILFIVALLFFAVLDVYLLFIYLDDTPYVKIGKNKIDVEIVDTEEARGQGLSGRESLGENDGMLFIFDDQNIAKFWMKDMNFPLDMIWINGNKIVNITKNVPPEGAEPDNIYSSDYPIDVVLEVNGGYCDKHNIQEGDYITYKFNR